MRDIKKLLRYILLVLVLLGVADVLLGFVFDNYFFLVENKSQKHAYEGGEEEIVIFGGSRAQNVYDPLIIQDSLGLKCWNYGSGGQNIYYHYALLNVLLQNAKVQPKIAILELAYIDFYNTPKWNTEKLSALNMLYAVNDTVKDIMRMDGYWKCMVLNYSNLYRYNSQLFYMLRNLKHNNSDESIKGFEPRYGTWSSSIQIITKEDNAVFDTNKLEYIKRFIALCKKNNIDLIITNSPNYRKFECEQKWVSKLQKIASDNGIIYLNHESDPYYLAHPEFFYDAFHLNRKGTLRYTSEIASEIKMCRKIIK